MYDELIKALHEGAEFLECSTPGIKNSFANMCHNAADAIEELTTLSRRQKVELVELTGELASKPRWIPVTERLPENDVHVLLSCKCGAGAYVCDGFHTAKYSTPTQFYEDIDADYDEGTDEYYFPEGWWEVIKNWDDYSCVAIEDTVTHWLPLPEPPKGE